MIIIFLFFLIANLHVLNMEIKSFSFEIFFICPFNGSDFF